MAQALPQDYDAQPAAAKLDLLWKNIENTRYHALPTTDPDPLTTLNLLNPIFLHATFEHPSDEVPEGHAPKVIHTFGSVAKVEMRLASGGAAAGFTGMFAADSIGLARVSLARHQIESFTPGLGIKMMIDGQKSKNMVAMNSLDGQGADRNVFSKPMSNVLPKPGSLQSFIIVESFKVSLASMHGADKCPFIDHDPADKPENPRIVPLLDAAKVNRDGSAVPNPKEMYQIFFLPTSQAKSAFEDVKDKDYRDALAKLPVGMPLWDIKAKRNSPGEDADEGKNGIHIGQMVTTSEFVASDYGDHRLFFQHMQHRTLGL